MPKQRTLPKNTEAESLLLNLMYYHGEGCKKTAESLRPEDFYDASHGILFGVLREAASKREKLNYVILKDVLESEGMFDKVGGKDGLSAIFSNKEAKDMPPDEVGKTAEKYLSMILGTANKRRLIEAADHIATSAYDAGTDAAGIVDEAEKSIMGISKGLDDGNGTEESLPIVVRVMEKACELEQNKGQITGIPTGFRDVDSLLLGIQSDDYVVIAARPSMGKTAFAMNIATNVAVYKKKPVLIFSLEMSSDQIVTRMLTSIAMIDSRRMKMGECSSEDWSEILKAGDLISGAPLFLNDRGGLTVGEIRRAAREAKAKYGIELIIIDYIQLMSGENKKDGRTQEVSEISRNLKALAKELHVPVIALSQLSRAVESRVSKRPMLSDLRESGSIEQDADIVMFLYREAYYTKDKEGVTDEDMDEVRDKAQVIISKNRNGDLGDVNMRFISQWTKFMDMPEPSIVK